MTNNTTMTGLEVATTILQQLGGRQFLVMVGGAASATPLGLIVKLGRGALQGITHLQVLLDEATDTYVVSFLKVRGTKITTVSTESMVYADALRATFETATGFATRL